MAGGPHQLNHPSSVNLISHSCLPLWLQTMNPERSQFLPGLLVLTSTAALFHSRLMLFLTAACITNSIYSTFQERVELSCLLAISPRLPFLCHDRYYLSFYSSEILRSNKDEVMCSSCRLEPKALLKNLFEFCYELKLQLLVHSVPNTVFVFNRPPIPEVFHSRLHLSPSLLKSCQKKFKVDWREVFQSAQGQKGQGWKLLAFGRPRLLGCTGFGGHSSSCREDAVAVRQE